MLKRGNHGKGEVGAWRLGANWRLHPLIHTMLKFHWAQYVESCKSRGAGGGQAFATNTVEIQSLIAM